MKRNLLLLSLLYVSTFTDLLAAPPSYIQTKDGVIIFTDPIFTGCTKAVKLEVVSDNIIRVTAAPGKEIVAAQSLVTIYSKKSDLSWNVVSSKETLTLKTKKLTAIVDLKTGAVTFRDANGKKILIEKPTGGRSFQSAIFDGRKEFKGATGAVTWEGSLASHLSGLHLYSGKWFAGGQKIVADAPYERMPVFAKAGSIIPFGPALQYTSEKKADTIMLNIYSGADASFNLYEDEGTNYNYEKGDYAFIPIKYTEATKTITVGDREGSFDGMLSKRIFRINLLSPEHARNLDFDAKGDKEIFYEGKKIAIKISSN